MSVFNYFVYQYVFRLLNKHAFDWLMTLTSKPRAIGSSKTNNIWK